jgi:hypothetical protein
LIKEECNRFYKVPASSKFKEKERRMIKKNENANIYSGKEMSLRERERTIITSCNKIPEKKN